MRMTEKQRQGYAERVVRCLAPRENGASTDRPPTIEEARSMLDRGGWTANETAFVTNDNTDWLVACQRGSDWMFSHGQTQLAAWRKAVERASQREPAGFRRENPGSGA